MSLGLSEGNQLERRQQGTRSFGTAPGTHEEVVEDPDDLLDRGSSPWKL